MEYLELIREADDNGKRLAYGLLILNGIVSIEDSVVYVDVEEVPPIRAAQALLNAGWVFNGLWEFEL